MIFKNFWRTCFLRFFYLAFSVSISASCRTAGSDLNESQPPSDESSSDLTKPHVLHPQCLDKPAFKTTETAGNQIRIVAWNVENLFDAKHDADKLDWEYMPRITHTLGTPISGDQAKIDGCTKAGEKAQTACLAAGKPADICDADGVRSKIRCFDQNWTDDLVTSKIASLKAAFDSHLSAAPEIMILTEVENQGIVSRLAREFGYSTAGSAQFTKEEVAAANSGDKTICKLSDNGTVRVTDSPDERGIDVAILVKPTKRGLRLITCREHALDVGFATRNILEVEFKFNDQALIVYGNHWPSQRSESSEPRMKAAVKLKELIAAQVAKNKNVSIVATGDFNSIDEDAPHPLNDVLLVGQPALKDVHTAYKSRYFKDVNLLPGTYYYGPKLAWNLLDRFFVNESALGSSGLRVNVGEYRVHRNPGMFNPNEMWSCRDLDAKKRYELAAGGTSLGFVAFKKDIVNAEVTKIFDDHPTLDCLKVVEQCAPWRQSTQNDVLSGTSDHFAVSVVLESK